MTSLRLPIRSAAFLLALAASAASAGAQGRGADLIARARSEMGNLNYDAALGLLEKAEATGQNPREQMLEIYRATGESQAALGRSDAAETAFRRALALDPKTELPAGTSPKLTAPLKAARDFLHDRRLAVECRRGPGGATLVVLSDPVDLVRGARLLGANGARLRGAADARGQGRVSLSVPSDAASEPLCAALDRHGNELARTALLAAAREAGPGAAGGAGDQTAGGDSTSVVETERREGDGSRPIVARWWVWGAAAAVAGSVSIFYGVKFKQAQDDFDAIQADSMNHTWDEAVVLQERGERYARATNIALAVTGGLALVSGGLLVYQLVTDGRREAPSASATASLGAAPLPGGAALTVSSPF